MTNHKEELLNNCITWIWEHIDSYTDMIQTFKRLGFSDEELLEYDLRDLNLEEDLDINIDDLQTVDPIEWLKNACNMQKGE